MNWICDRDNGRLWLSEYFPVLNFLCVFVFTRYESHFLSEVMVQRSGPSEEKITTDQRCLIHCYQTLPSSVGQRTLLEYCNIQAEASVGNNCIVSNVELPSGASIPDNTFMMTVCVTVDNVSGLYVTVVFGIKDNVKRTAPSDDLAKLQYFGLPLDKAMSLLDLAQVVISYMFS